MYCGNCGAELSDREMFCHNCGRKLGRPSAVPAAKKRGMSKTAQFLIGIPILYFSVGLAFFLYELLTKAPWYTYQNIFGETHIIFQEPGSSQLPVFVRVIETLLYPLLMVFRSL